MKIGLFLPFKWGNEYWCLEIPRKAAKWKFKPCTNLPGDVLLSANELFNMRDTKKTRGWLGELGNSWMKCAIDWTLQRMMREEDYRRVVKCESQPISAFELRCFAMHAIGNSECFKIANPITDVWDLYEYKPSTYCCRPIPTVVISNVNSLN